MKNLVIILTIALSLAACGVRGDPVDPSKAGKKTQQTQQ